MSSSVWYIGVTRFQKIVCFFSSCNLFHFPCFGKNIFSKHKRPRGGVLRAVDIIFKVSHSQSYFFWHVKRSRFVKPLFLVEPSVTNHDHDLTKRTWSGGIWCRNEQKVRLGINRSISPCYCTQIRPSEHDCGCSIRLLTWYRRISQYSRQGTMGKNHQSQEQHSVAKQT